MPEKNPATVIERVAAKLAEPAHASDAVAAPGGGGRLTPPFEETPPALEPRSVTGGSPGFPSRADSGKVLTTLLPDSPTTAWRIAMRAPRSTGYSKVCSTRLLTLSLTKTPSVLAPGEPAPNGNPPSLRQKALQ